MIIMTRSLIAVVSFVCGLSVGFGSYAAAAAVGLAGDERKTKIVRVQTPLPPGQALTAEMNRAGAGRGLVLGAVRCAQNPAAADHHSCSIIAGSAGTNDLTCLGVAFVYRGRKVTLLDASPIPPANCRPERPRPSATGRTPGVPPA